MTPNWIDTEGNIVVQKLESRKVADTSFLLVVSKLFAETFELKLQNELEPFRLSLIQMVNL